MFDRALHSRHACEAVAMRVRQMTANMKVQCVEVGKKTTQSRDLRFVSESTRRKT
jgi:hypothetical protein